MISKASDSGGDKGKKTKKRLPQRRIKRQSLDQIKTHFFLVSHEYSSLH